MPSVFFFTDFHLKNKKGCKMFIDVLWLAERKKLKTQPEVPIMLIITGFFDLTSYFCLISALVQMLLLSPITQY